MTIDLALDLTVERISLLEQNSGRWHRLADASCDASNLVVQIRKLRETTVDKRALEGQSQPSLFAILPEEQIFYGTISGVEGDLPPDHLSALLEGQTPFPVSELRFDWRKRGGSLQFAALPLQTLIEAEAFLTSHGFVCAGVLACKCDAEFDGAPWFGSSSDAAPFSMAPAVSGRTVVSIDRRKILAHPPVAPIAAPEPQIATSETLARLARATKMDPTHQTHLSDPDLDLDPATIKAPPRLSAQGGKSLGARALVNGGLLTAALAVGLGAVAFWPDSTPDLSEQTSGIIRAPAPDVAAPELTQTPKGSSDIALSAPAQQPQNLVPVSINSADVPLATTAQTKRDSLPPAPNLVSDGATFYTPASVVFRSTRAETLDGLIEPAIDPEQGADALALTPVAIPEAADFPVALASPPPSDVTFAVDDRGLVRPSGAGQETPEGFLVFAGTPSSSPPQRPAFEFVEPPAPEPLSQAQLAEDDPMRGIVPKLRPDGLAERFERAGLGGRTYSELGRLRPAQRPASVSEAYALKLAAQSAADAVTATAELRRNTGPRPKARPNDMARRYAASQTAPKATKTRTSPAKATAAASTAGVQKTARTAETVSPKIPTKASVSKHATVSRAMNLARINLLGTFGSNSSPRALVRMPSGRVVNISIGDKLDGGRVASIGQGRLSYVKRGKTVTLNMPKG